MKKQVLIGVAGSALVLLFDVFAIEWSGNNNWIRAGVAAVVFGLATILAKFLPKGGVPGRAVGSDNEVKGTMTVNAGEISAEGAERVLSANKIEGDFSVTVDKIDS